jgi:pimeloyl-ACP methyl ester carboxylesterase
MPFATVNDVRLYYESTGDTSKPPILQFGGSLFGRQNFGFVNDGFREHFHLISFDARGYGRSDAPLEPYSIEERADDGAGLLDALGYDRAFVHGTSMGGMVTIAFVGKYPERTIAACADCGMARCDLHRRTLFRTWRNMAEAMPLDEMSDAITLQAVGATYLERHPETFGIVRSIIGKNSHHTIRQACVAMEEMDIEHLARQIRRPILLTNGTHDVMTPPRLAASGFSAEDIVKAVPEWARLHEFPDIGHADLLECPDEAVRIVTGFFLETLERGR